jgi:hypothetical protein
MLSQPTSGLVGLIVIDASGAHDDVTPGGNGHNDATLGQILRWLACGMDTAACVAVETAPRPGVHRLTRRSLGPDRPARVVADCPGLGKQLERAARQLRQRMAMAHADAR